MDEAESKFRKILTFSRPGPFNTALKLVEGAGGGVKENINEMISLPSFYILYS